MISLRYILISATGGALLLGGATWNRSSAAPPPPVEAQAPATLDVAPAVPAPAPAPAPPSEEVLDLQGDLRGMMNGSTARNASYGVLIVSLDHGDTLFAHNADQPLAPASNLKLYSTAAALYYLGPEFRYSTYALADGPVHDGILDGDLILYGTGDPTLSSRMLRGALTPLRALVDSLSALGVREVRGDVVGDGSYFDDRWIGEGWREEYRLASYSAPIGALSLAENIVSVRVRPGGSVGDEAQITTTPSTDGLLVRNRVRTISSGRSSVRFSYDPEGITVEGQLTRGHPGVARTVTVVDPGNYAAAAFRNLLEDAGIRVGGTVRSIRDANDSPVGRATRSPSGAEGVAPPPRIIGTHLSPTLAEIISVTNHVSMNLYAEAMFKTVGRVALGEGTFAAGAEAVRYFLECEEPFDFAGVNIVDGSGLSPLNRVTPRSTVHLLDLMTRTDVWEPFYNSLPVAASPEGGRHSLRNRMGGTSAARNLHAKTGTINNVSSLSGYVRADNGELLAFSIIGNDLGSTWSAKRLEDQIGARLARFSRPAPEEAPLGEPSEPAVDSAAAEPAPAPAPTPAPATEARPAPAPRPAAPASRTHRVRRGETLGEIAEDYGISLSELQRLNPGLDARRIQIGQEIKVPGSGATTTTSAPAPAARPAPQPSASTATRTHRVRSGETLGEIAEDYGTSLAELQRLNPGLDARRIQIGQEIKVPGASSGAASSSAPAPSQPASRTHTVASGETLDAIAKRYGTTVAELQRLNPRIQPRRLQIGQRLTVPSR